MYDYRPNIKGIVAIILAISFSVWLVAPAQAQVIFPEQPVKIFPGYGANGAGMHLGVPFGLPGNDCVINPVSMTHMRVLQTSTNTTLVPGDVITIPATVLFDFDKDIVLPEGKSILADRIYARLVKFGVTSIEVIGHTDSRGTDEYNVGLGQRRADAVASVLVFLGFPDTAVATSSGGEKFPLAHNENADGSDNPEGRQTNRRVELVVNKVSDVRIETEVTEEVMVARNSQIFHRLSSNANVTCSSGRGSLYYGAYGPYNRYNYRY
jgi:outer membrane protein OmpA-like peptidoglycan-associated protein